MAARDGDRHAQGVEQAAGDQRSAVGAVQAGEQHGELVTAEPAGGVTGAQQRGDALRDRDQDGVAGGVPELVVDGLEVVEVEVEHGQAAARSALAGRVQDPVDEQRPAREPGEVVGEDALLQLGAALLGGREPAGDPGGREQHAHLLGERGQQVGVGAVQARGAAATARDGEHADLPVLDQDRGSGEVGVAAGEHPLGEVRVDLVAERPAADLDPRQHERGVHGLERGPARPVQRAGGLLVGDARHVDVGPGRQVAAGGQQQLAAADAERTDRRGEQRPGPLVAQAAGDRAGGLSDDGEVTDGASAPAVREGAQQQQPGGRHQEQHRAGAAVDQQHHRAGAQAAGGEARTEGAGGDAQQQPDRLVLALRRRAGHGGQHADEAADDDREHGGGERAGRRGHRRSGDGVEERGGGRGGEQPAGGRADPLHRPGVPGQRQGEEPAARHDGDRGGRLDGQQGGAEDGPLQAQRVQGPPPGDPQHRELGDDGGEQEDPCRHVLRRGRRRPSGPARGGGARPPAR